MLIHHIQSKYISLHPRNIDKNVKLREISKKPMSNYREKKKEFLNLTTKRGKKHIMV